MSKVISDEMVDRMIEFYTEGNSLAATAKEVGCSIPTVRRYLSLNPDRVTIRKVGRPPFKNLNKEPLNVEPEVEPTVLEDTTEAAPEETVTDTLVPQRVVDW